MKNFVTGWYLLYTRPRHEKKVAAALTEAAVTVYLPTAKKLRTWCDRKKYIDEPLFPSYVFAQLNSPHDYFNSLNADGSMYFVKFGKEIARVSQSVIDDIKLVVDKGTDIEVTAQYFSPGQHLVISQGPLTGLSCEVVQYNGKEKLLVRVHLLQRSILVTLPPVNLMAVSA
jgi:transcription antitermination factor NusG